MVVKIAERTAGGMKAAATIANGKTNAFPARATLRSTNSVSKYALSDVPHEGAVDVLLHGRGELRRSFDGLGPGVESLSDRRLGGMLREWSPGSQAGVLCRRIAWMIDLKGMTRYRATRRYMATATVGRTRPMAMATT